MKFNTILVYVSVYLISCHISYANSVNMKLELVQVIFRHGARTPSKEEARLINVTDPAIYGSYGFGQLTNEGKEQAYNLGSLLRERYDEFLGSYNPKEIYALSSNYDRTKMSLQLVLSGLFPPGPEETWNNQLNWRPIPFQHTTTELDILLAPHQCPKFKETYRKEIANSEDYQEKLSNYMDFLRSLEEKTGFSYRTNIIYYTGWTYYVIKIHKGMNLPLPSWCTEDIYKGVTEMIGMSLNSMSGSQKLKRLNGGTLIRRVLENINENSSATERKKIYLYSNHDLTLAAFTKAQNINAFEIPPFGSAIILEKYRDDQNVEYVKMLSWDGSAKNFTTLRIGNYEEFCPLKEYKKMVEGVIPSDEELDFLAGN